MKRKLIKRNKIRVSSVIGDYFYRLLIQHDTFKRYSRVKHDREYHLEGATRLSARSESIFVPIVCNSKVKRSRVKGVVLGSLMVKIERFNEMGGTNLTIDDIPVRKRK